MTGLSPAWSTVSSVPDTVPITFLGLFDNLSLFETANEFDLISVCESDERRCLGMSYGRRKLAGSAPFPGAFETIHVD